MTKRKKRNAFTLVSLLFLMVILIVVYFWFSKREKASDSTKDSNQESQVLATVDTKKISSLHYKGKDADLKLVLKDGKWISEENPDRPINQENVNAMINLLGNVSAVQTVNKKPENLEDYGLSSPTAYLQATLKDKSTITIQVGNKATGADGYYAFVNEDGKVYLLDSSYGTSLAYSDMDMTAVEVAPAITSENILHIKLENKEGEDFDLQYDKGNNIDYSNANLYPWVITKPYEEKIAADTNKVTELLSKYSSYTFVNCVDYTGKGLEAYGLKDPAASIYVKYKEAKEASGKEDSKDADKTEGVEKEYKIFVGNKDEAGNYYVKTEKSDAVYTMSVTDIDEKLNVDAFSLISPFIAIPNIDKVDKITVKIEGTTHTMEIKRETSKNKEGKEETKATYYHNGKTVEEDVFKSVYQSLVAASYDAQIKDEKIDKKEKPYMTISYFLAGDKKATMKASYIPYDESFYLVDTGEAVRFFADKRKIDDIAKAVIAFKKQD